MNSGPNGEWLATTPEYWARCELPVIGWQLWYASKLWYEGNWCVTSADCEWHDAPSNGVQVMMVYHPGGRRTIVTGKDEYTHPTEAGSKLGVMIAVDRFNAIRERAMADEWRP